MTDTVKIGTGGTEEEELLALSKGVDICSVVNKEYKEIISLFGIDIALKIYKNYKGCRIECPKHFYNMEFIIKVAAEMTDKRERERIAILCGYSGAWIESNIRAKESKSEKEIQ